MPLEAPNLDSRTFDQIYREARARIPRYTKEWTDYNDSDPGITLVQLFAWLTEMMLFELNRVPELNYIKFLQLLNLELDAALPAEAQLTFTASPSSDLLTVPKGTQVEGIPPNGGDPLIFETERDLQMVRHLLARILIYDGNSFTERTIANEREGETFAPFGWTPQPGNALYLGFQPLEESPTKSPFPPVMTLRFFKPQAKTAGQPQRFPEPKQIVEPPSGVRLIWEYKTANDPKPGVAAPWRKLDKIDDETGALISEGTIQIEGPAEIKPSRLGSQTEEFYWFRCRLEAGSYPVDQVPEVDFIRMNTVKAINLTTVRNEVLGVSEGTPHQSFSLRFLPIQPGSLELETENDSGERTLWKAFDDLVAAGPDDQHYRLDRSRGKVDFGDNRNGIIPTPDHLIVARTYRYGGGEAGNLPVDAITGLVNPPSGIEGVTNERPAIDGRDEQSVDNLKATAPSKIRSRQRAVTAEDYKALAEAAPGVNRAEAIPLAHPDFPEVEVPGVVSLLIVPETSEYPPIPSEDLLRAVGRYLEPFRTISTELHVRGPKYKAIKVDASIYADSRYELDEVKREVIKEINRLLDPSGRRSRPTPEESQVIANAPLVLSRDATGATTLNERGGQQQKPWDFGQELYPTGLYATIIRVDGVLGIEKLAIRVNGRPHEDLTKPVVLNHDELLYGVEEHEIVVRSIRNLQGN